MNAPTTSPIMAALTDEEFQKIAAIASEEAGLSIPDSKRSLVQSRISRRLRHLRLPTCRDYLQLLSDAPSEKRELVSILTTNVSSFYRESHHFEFLRKTIFPSIPTRLNQGDRVRFWSAGCSSGEEPYTLAIELLKAIPEAASSDLLILASDIDPKILERAKTGTYSPSAVDTIAPEDRRKFLTASSDDDEMFSVGDELRNLVRFRELNLHATWPMRHPFDVIMCRNVVIYFDEHRQRELWPRFREMLVPGGRLILGHSERIHPIESSGFTTESVTVYRRT